MPELEGLNQSLSTGWNKSWASCGKQDRDPQAVSICCLCLAPWSKPACVHYSLAESSFYSSPGSLTAPKSTKGTHLPDVRSQGLGDQCVVQTPHSPGRIYEPIISPPLLYPLQVTWVLTWLILLPSYPTPCLECCLMIAKADYDFKSYQDQNFKQ